ncbi:MAG: ribonuclease T [Legionella sp.]|nr:ribonuclease T [Legionella sp.]
MALRERFRGFLPVVVDVETTGIDPCKNALLEVCIVLIRLNQKGFFEPDATHFEHVLPFEGAEMDPQSLAFNKIDPFYPLRFAINEKQALKNLFTPIHKALKMTQCSRAVLVGHNAWFDLLFLKEATKRSGMISPFHSFTCFDTATLAGLMYGQTVLSKAVKAAGLDFNADEAHSAIYDAEKTAALFCIMLNEWQKKSAFPF